MPISDPVPRETWRIGLFAKMILVSAPVFLIVATLGLWVVLKSTTVDSVDALSARLGSSAARVGTALERHSRNDTSSDPWASPLPGELLNTLLADRAIRCVVFKREDAAGTELVAPRGLGCVGQTIEDRFSIPLSTGVPSSLTVGFDRAEIAAQRRTWLHVSIAVVLSGLLLSILAAWIGFRIFLRAPLHRLLFAIEKIKETESCAPVAGAQRDELGSVITAFNRMQARDSVNVSLLEQERSRFACVIDSMMEGLLVVDRGMRVRMVNRALCDLLNRPEEDIVGKSILTFFRSNGERAGRAGSSCPVEAILSDNSTAPVQTSVSSMHFEGETAVVCVVRGISEAIERENKLRQLSFEACAANKAKTEFLSNMSHELRTPLNAIIGFSEMMAIGMVANDPEKQISYAQDIYDSGQHLLAVINDILDLAKIEVGEIKLYPTRIDLRALSMSVERVMRDQALQRGVRLDIEKPDDAIALVADELRLKQVMINLVSNAIKFSEKGGTVTVTAIEDGETVTLAVTDTGIGMDEAEIKEAMEPFRQVDNSHTRQYEGTGLGLPLSKNLVNIQGGSLVIHSAPGCGTTVSVSFPQSHSTTEIIDGDDGALTAVAC